MPGPFQIAPYKGIVAGRSRDIANCGPHNVGTKLYTVLMNSYLPSSPGSFGSLDVWLSTDTATTWAIQDSANSPPIGNNAGTASFVGPTFAAVVNDTNSNVFWVAYGWNQQSTNTLPYPLPSFMAKFDYVNNTWAGTYTGGPTYDDGHIALIHLAQRDNGTLVVLTAYTTDVGAGNRFHPVCTEFDPVGHTFGTPISYTGTASIFEQPFGICAGSAGRVHCFFATSEFDASPNSALLKTIVFDTNTTFSNEVIVGSNIPKEQQDAMHPVYYNSGSASGTIIVGAQNYLTSNLNVFTAAEAASPSFSLSDTGDASDSFTISAQINGTTTEAVQMNDDFNIISDNENTGSGWVNGTAYIALIDGGNPANDLAGLASFDIGTVFGTNAIIIDETTNTSNYSLGHTIILFPTAPTPPVTILGLVLGPLNLTY
jgi:hypothetical protein